MGVDLRAAAAVHHARAVEHTEYDVRVRGRTAPRHTWSFWPWARPSAHRQRRLHASSHDRRRRLRVAPRPRAGAAARDNPVLILLWIGLLVAALAAMLSLADRSSQLSPDFLSEVVLYAVSVADLTLMLALVFVLARNILKLVVERRRALPFARFRAKLVAVLLGMTLIPAVLVLIVGSELIRNSASRWFSAADRQVLGSAREIASDYYAERTRAVTAHADGAGAGARDRRSRRERSARRSAASSGRARPAPVEPGRGLSRHRARDAAGGAGGRRRGADPAARLRAGVRARLAHGLGRSEPVARAAAAGGELVARPAPIRPSPARRRSAWSSPATI